MQQTQGRWGEHNTYPRMTSATIAGGTAGDLAVAGIKVGDTIAIVQNVAATGVDLSGEFEITAADTINNAGGTDTTGMTLLVIWYQADAGLTG